MEFAFFPRLLHHVMKVRAGIKHDVHLAGPAETIAAISLTNVSRVTILIQPRNRSCESMEHQS